MGRWRNSTGPLKAVIIAACDVIILPGPCARRSSESLAWQPLSAWRDLRWRGDEFFAYFPKWPSASSCACSMKQAAKRGWHCRKSPAIAGTAISRHRTGAALRLPRAWPWAPEQGNRCNPAKLLLDPYAKGIYGDIAWDEAVFPYPFNSDPDVCNDGTARPSCPAASSTSHSSTGLAIVSCNGPGTKRSSTRRM